MRILIALFLLASGFWLPASARAADVQEVKTPGGFTVWLVEEHNLPLIAVKIAFKGSGFAHDPEGREGRASMTAAMLMEGAGDMDARRFQEALESHAVELDMAADEDDLVAAMECLRDHREKAFSYFGKALTEPRFDRDAVERARGQVLTALKQQEETPGYKLRRAWQKLVFGTHPYSKPELGTPEGLGRLDGSDLEGMTHRYLTKENIVIAAVGDITPDELSRLLDENLKALPEKYDPDVKIEDIHLPSGKEPVTVDFDIPQTIVAFGAEGLKRNDPDYFSAFVMNQILGGGGNLNTRLGGEIREKRGLAYSVYTYLEPLSHAASWRGGFATRSDQAPEARGVLVSTLKDFVEQGPSDQEMTDAKQFLTGSFVLGLDSNAEIASFLLTMQINQLGRDYLDRRNSLVEAVTKKDVHAMAKRLIDPDKLLIVTIGKPPAATDAAPEEKKTE